MKKLHLTIGIPAHNEEATIAPMLLSLLKQAHSSYILDTIYVVADGCTDQTIHAVTSVSDPRIKLVRIKSRRGKPYAMNIIISKTTSDLLLLLDADQSVSSPDVLDTIVQPFLIRPNVHMASGIAQYFSPTNWTERIAKARIDIWVRAIEHTANADLYYSSGAIAAFRKDLYTRIQFPNLSADDAYAYLMCKRYGYGFAKIRHTGIYNRLPSRFTDFQNQMLRFLDSEPIQRKYFDDAMVEKYYVIGAKQKITALLWYIAREPVSAVLYLISWVYIQILRRFTHRDESALWTIAVSTKGSK